MSQQYKVLFLNPRKCTGCRLCSLACSMKHEGYFSLVHSRNEIIRLPGKGLNVNVVCRHCTDPPCALVCPRRAISRNPETGAMVIDQDRCIGCQSCVIACPIGGVAKNMDTGRIIKCNLCDGDPECAKNCAYGAITYAPMNEGLSDKRKTVIEAMGKYQEVLDEA